MGGLTCYRFGRRIRFDEKDVETIKARLRAPYPTTISAPRYPERQVVSGKALRSTESPQVVVQTLLDKLMRKPSK